MGERGPVPKRSDQRRRRNKTEGGIDSAPTSSSRKLGPPCPDWLLGLGKTWYESLGTSGQAVFYTDSDWATALVVAKAIDTFDERPTAMMLASIMSACSSLVCTEGDRRRLRIELERGERVDEDAEAGVASMETWRKKLTGSAP